MTKLEAKDKMSPVQLAIVLISIMLGPQIITAASFIAEVADQWGWLSLALAGGIFLGNALLMVKLGRFFPNETIVEYAPKIVGYPIGVIIVFGLIAIFFGEMVYVVHQFINVVSFYMFDRTPPGILALLFVITAAYGAAQDWGTLLRVVQFFYFTTTTFLFVFSSTMLLNYVPNNMLPWWPQNIPGVVKGALSSWGIFSGYEIILLILPLVYRGETGISRAVIGGFGITTIMYTFGMILLTGVLTSGVIKATVYPTVVAMRSVELPGTFIERLENYFLVVWMPTVYLSFTLSYYSVASLLNRLFAMKDQRIFVFWLGPFILAGSVLLDQPDKIENFNKIMNMAGLAFSFGIIPVLLMITMLRRRKEYSAGQ